MSLQVLTIDDSKTIRRIVTKAFDPFDAVVSEAENGVEGLSAAMKQRPDLIILDITMPVMNGIEMLGKLKAEPALKDIPVIMLTAESGKENVVSIIKMGVKDYIVKPFKGEQLIERVTKLFQLAPRKEGGEDAQGSGKFLKSDPEAWVVTVPAKLGRTELSDLETELQSAGTLLQNGPPRLILDLSRTTEVNMTTIRMIISVMNSAQKNRLKFGAVGSATIAEELKGFQETSHLQLVTSLAEAKGL